MIVADVVQSEYEKLHKSKKSQQVESVRNVLELLLQKSIDEESRISGEMSGYKKNNQLPFLEDEKKDTADRKSRYQAEITKCKLEQIRINSLLRQILQIQMRIGNETSSLQSADVAGDNFCVVLDGPCEDEFCAVGFVCSGCCFGECVIGV